MKKFAYLGNFCVLSKKNCFGRICSEIVCIFGNLGVGKLDLKIRFYG